MHQGVVVQAEHGAAQQAGERDVVVGVVHGPQGVEHVEHFLLAVEVAARDDVKRYSALRKLPLVRRADGHSREQDRDVAVFHRAFFAELVVPDGHFGGDHFFDSPGYDGRLGGDFTLGGDFFSGGGFFAGVGEDYLDRRAVEAVLAAGADRRIRLAHQRPEQPVDKFRSLLQRAEGNVKLLQLAFAHARAKVLELLDRGPAETVNALLAVADQEKFARRQFAQAAVAENQRLKQVKLQLVGVLGLVDQKLADLPAQRLADLGVCLQELVRQIQQVVEVQHSG